MCSVALRNESVDRNINLDLFRSRFLLSLSARRAWIEIIHTAPKGSDNAVALRKESVDRNNTFFTKRTGKVMSLSARRAWIEISKYAL